MLLCCKLNNKLQLLQHLGTALVCKAIEAMVARNADLVVLETEVSNKGAIALYERLNFVR
jgi:peptide alpha-N-acetyltransferase